MMIIIRPFIKLSFAHYATLNYLSLAINKLHKGYNCGFLFILLGLKVHCALNTEGSSLMFLKPCPMY